MPKPGFKSITISGKTYDKLFELWQQNKDVLRMRGVNSFSGFCVMTLEELQKQDKTFQKYGARFEKIAIDKQRIIIKDNNMDRIVEITIKKGYDPALFCELCEKSSCVHIGFVYSIPQAYPVMN